MALWQAALMPHRCSAGVASRQNSGSERGMALLASKGCMGPLKSRDFTAFPPILARCANHVARLVLMGRPTRGRHAFLAEERWGLPPCLHRVGPIAPEVFPDTRHASER